MKIPLFRVVYAFNTGRGYTPYGQRIAFTEVAGGVYFMDIDRGIRGYYKCEAYIDALLHAYDAAGAELWRPAEYDPNQLEKEEWDAAEKEFRLLEKVLKEAAESLGEEDKAQRVKIVRLPGMMVRIPQPGGRMYDVYEALLISHRVATDDDPYNYALDGLEALVLAHASAGVEIWKSNYVRGIATAMESIANNVP